MRGSARPFAASCGGRPCPDPQGGRRPPGRAPLRSRQECAGPRADGAARRGPFVLRHSSAAHVVRDRPAGKAPADGPALPRSLRGMPCRPARDSRENAPAVPAGASARRPFALFPAGRRACCSSSACSRGIRARGRLSAPPSAHAPAARPPQIPISCTRLHSDGGWTESGARAERRPWRHGRGVLFAAPFGFQGPPTRPAGLFERALGAHRPFKVIRSRLFGDIPAALAARPSGQLGFSPFLGSVRAACRRAGMRGQPRPLHYAPAACAATAATRAFGPPRRAASASLKSTGRGGVGGGEGRHGRRRPAHLRPMPVGGGIPPAGWRHAAPRLLQPPPRAEPACPCPHRPAAAIRADIAKTPRGLLRSA